MKVGLRSPSIKKSVKARTTGRINRTLKKSVNPFYGKKGVGLIHDPKKAVYNKVYHKVTIDPLEPIKHPQMHNSTSDQIDDLNIEYTKQDINLPLILSSTIASFGMIYVVIKLITTNELHPIVLAISIVCSIIMLILRRKNED